MNICIGTDEAGYGPNLGPLVIAATAWELPEGMQPSEMWSALEDVLTDVPTRTDQRLHVADSKKVYSAGRSVYALERSVFAFLSQLDLQVSSLADLGHGLCGETFGPDYAHIHRTIVDDLDLPTKVSAEDVSADSSALAAALRNSEMKLCSIECRMIFPPEFNRIVAQTGSKGIVLSNATLKLVRSAVNRSGNSHGWVVCDKHGGRNRYDDIISAAFDDDFVFRLQESGPASRYRVRNMEFCFRTKAEELLPVALASMTAKYMREMVMLQFNRYWQHHLPDLKPTKGYPVDARRFWEDIEATAVGLQICKSEVWRNR